MSTRSDEAKGEPDGDVLAALDLNRLRDGNRRSLDPANQALFDEVWDLRHPTESSAETPTPAAPLNTSERAVESPKGLWGWIVDDVNRELGVRSTPAGLTVETLAALIERSEHAWRNDDNTTEPRNVYVAKAILNTGK